MKTVKMHEETLETGERVRVVDLGDTEPTVYTCMVQLERGEAWRLIHVNEPAHREHAVDSPEALTAAGRAAVSFARDAQERIDKWEQSLSGAVAFGTGHMPTSMYQIRCGVVMLAFGLAGNDALIVWTDLPSLAEMCQEVGAAGTDDVGLGLGCEAPDAGIWLAVVRESIIPESNTPDGYSPQELEFDVVCWGEPLWHYARNRQGGLERIDGQEDDGDTSETPGDA